jgi:crotonobetainyl-CoA:carnitine CoA-transferase CaiB-like acyl-CoA transferase
VLTRTDLLSHDQIAANAILIETEHAEAGRLRQTRPAARFSQMPVEDYRGAPALGADTRAVLAENGFCDADIAALARSGAIDATGEPS